MDVISNSPLFDVVMDVSPPKPMDTCDNSAIYNTFSINSNISDIIIKYLLLLSMFASFVKNVMIDSTNFHIIYFHIYHNL